MYVPFAIIKAAKECDGEAADFIFRHFKGYIASKCQVRYIDEYGKTGSYIDEDLRYRAEAALLSAIFPLSSGNRRRTLLGDCHPA